jgi:MoaA/NifB/PqqE/SkfB family radical SAM enzyme
MFNYLNIELTNRCNKRCPFCGHREHVKECGDMSIDLFHGILYGMDGLEIIQFHRDGEPLLYPYLSNVLEACSKKGIISNIVTNGRLLNAKTEQLVDCNSITVSVYEKDDEQYEQIKSFKYQEKLIIKVLGDYPAREYSDYFMIHRQIHSPEHSKEYKKLPIIPEIGICWDIFKPSINYNGEMFICNRNDIEKKGLLGDLNESSIYELWYGDKRMNWLNKHKENKRQEVPLCVECEYWGIPTV